jgi:hypothetical protein
MEIGSDFETLILIFIYPIMKNYTIIIPSLKENGIELFLMKLTRFEMEMVKLRYMLVRLLLLFAGLLLEHLSLIPLKI